MDEQQQRELAERIADKERHAATMRRAADYDALMARAEAAEALARRNNDDAAMAEAKALGLEFENERLAARVAELEAKADRHAQDYDDLYQDYREMRRNWEGTADIGAARYLAEARVAELESQLAAQGWRPVTEKPEPDQKVEIIIEATFDGYGRKGWTTGGYYFNADYPTGWRPLPPAPQETE